MPAFASYLYGVGPEYQIPDPLWERFLPVLDEHNGQRPPRKKPGRPRMEDRQAMTAIFYVVRTGCQWKALPKDL